MTPPATPSGPAAPPHPAARVGVVVITRNRRERLLHTLDRLAALPERPPVTVVDNASTDHTAHAVRTHHPGVTLLTPGRNLGAAGRNLGAAALTTPYIAFADDDSWWEAGALAHATRLFDTHPRLALIAAATHVGPAGHPDPLNHLLATSPLGHAPDLPGPSVLGFLACAAVVRRDAFLAAGGFHPLLHFGGEETLLALDLAAAGWGLAHCPQVIARHDPDPGPRAGRTARLLRNELLTLWMRRPLPHALARTWAVARACPADPAARTALAAALARLPAALARRRPLPPAVEHSLTTLETPPAPPPHPACPPAPPAPHQGTTTPRENTP
ncbi:glycosyltransferase family 2 protein [Streptomyces syringium]|uniref:glycosyltransferase family 2 protein n=1 Tax=Streptomyces syringium TaxID=76729 RepID=UPI0034552A66